MLARAGRLATAPPASCRRAALCLQPCSPPGSLRNKPGLAFWVSVTACLRAPGPMGISALVLQTPSPTNPAASVTLPRVTVSATASSKLAGTSGPLTPATAHRTETGNHATGPHRVRVLPESTDTPGQDFPPSTRDPAPQAPGLPDRALSGLPSPGWRVRAGCPLCRMGTRAGAAPPAQSTAPARAGQAARPRLLCLPENGAQAPLQMGG